MSRERRYPCSTSPGDGHRLASYAVDVPQGAPGETDTVLPFRWLPERREQQHPELDAAMVQLPGLCRVEAGHELGGFDVLRTDEERDNGEFGTKRLVMAAYDSIAAPAAAGGPRTSLLDRPPGSRLRHPARA